MLRVIAPILILGCLATPGMAADPPRIAPRPLASALDAVQAGRWQVAARLAARDGPAAETLIEWYRLLDGRGSVDEVLTFLRENPAWPGLGTLRRRNEELFARAGFDDVLEFYQAHPPQTGIGVLNHSRALVARGRVGEAEAGVVLAWRTLDLTGAEHDAFLEAHSDLLAPHHEARLQMALWRGLRDVQDMLPLVPEKARGLAETRQLIEKRGSGLEKRLKELTDAERRDPGVAHALFNHHIKRGETDEAVRIILRQSRLQGGLGEPGRWAGWRRALARERMRDGAAVTAYELASVHQLVEGSAYADLEWLSGYLALTYLDDPETALGHFTRFREAVETPISLGRAGYWVGRAHDAMGNAEAAGVAYAFGARYQTSFYGLLSAERGGLPPDPSLAGNAPEIPDWRDAPLARDKVFRAGVLALASGRDNLAERLFTHLAGRLDRVGIAQLGQALEELEAPHQQVMVGKAAARRGMIVSAPYYPLHPLHRLDLPVPAELALSIARRESEFDDLVVSGAGAQGLMQIMPATASDVARGLGIKHERRRVLEDWRYNAHLGAAYLEELARRFGGNVVLMAAGYNAGPSRPIRWMTRFGDPRLKGVDAVDWIEHIPFRETRNYVMRVAESLPVYRARLGLDPHPVPFSQELAGSTLLPPQTD